MDHKHFHSDEPIIDDFVGHEGHIASVRNMIESFNPPCVIGIHGDWGSGKTSFLCKLYKEFTGGAKPPVIRDKNEESEQQSVGKNQNIEAIWFDAWRYQFESNPVIALLNEIRSHFTLSHKFVGKVAKLGYAALMSLEELTKKIGFSIEKAESAGEKWEQKTLSHTLPSQLCKDLLENAISELLELGRSKKQQKSSKRLIIFIDDLDRCMGETAFRFLESLKIYLSLSNCIFILALDVRHIRRAVAAELAKSGKLSEEENKPGVYDIYAADYLNKMFQFIFYLPHIVDCRNYLEKLMDESMFGKEKQDYINAIIQYELLPSNPRKIKLFINGLMFYLENLKLRFKDGETPDPKLTLIFAYLKYMANDVYRMVEAEKGDFWRERLMEFCKSGSHNDHWALRKLVVPKIRVSETDAVYESIFPDPSDERLFRAAILIQEWSEGAPSKEEFQTYLLQ